MTGTVIATATMPCECGEGIPVLVVRAANGDIGVLLAADAQPEPRHEVPEPTALVHVPCAKCGHPVSGRSTQAVAVGLMDEHYLVCSRLQSADPIPQTDRMR